jgi:uncharacterized SAM-binding protein YcdF (DUF218 family)
MSEGQLHPIPGSDRRQTDRRRSGQRRVSWVWRLIFPFLGRGRIFWGLVSALAFTALGVLGLAYIQAGEIYEFQDTVDGVHLPKVDAIVCLAGGRGRITAAGDIWYRYWEIGQTPLKGAGPSPLPAAPPVLYISGMGPKSTFASLRKQVRRGVLDALKPSDVILETESLNTDENARYVARFVAERGWEHLLLITSSYHMLRSKFIFENVLAQTGHPIQIETFSYFQEPFEPGEWRGSFQGVRVTMLEYFKWLYYRRFWNPEAGGLPSGPND